MKIWVVLIIAVVFVYGCAKKPTGLLVKQNISYETKIKHLKDCRAIAKGQAPTHYPASTYSGSSMASQPIAAQAAAGVATGFVEGWMRAKAESEKYRGCLSDLGYRYVPLNADELKKYGSLSNSDKEQFMHSIYQDTLSGKRKTRKY